MIGLGAVGGVGFTVSLFVASLAFIEPELIDQSKVGIFLGSAVAGVIGAAVLLSARKADAD
jgi:NhaA family Na+:H+ antiporter